MIGVVVARFHDQPRGRRQQDKGRVGGGGWNDHAHALEPFYVRGGAWCNLWFFFEEGRKALVERSAVPPRGLSTRVPGAWGLGGAYFELG